jgi:hypothetical protein
MISVGNDIEMLVDNNDVIIKILLIMMLKWYQLKMILKC